jgi:hypothetical protein
VNVTPLTLEHACDVAAHLCAPHRADVLRDFSSPSDWAAERVRCPGSAWAALRGRAVFIGGVESAREDTGVLWMAGVEGWTRYVKHAIKIARAILTSGAYKHYQCEVHEADQASRRFAEHLGFSEIQTRDGLVLYGVTP